MEVDLFGLGALLFFGLFGRLPFWGSTTSLTLQMTVHGEFEFPQTPIVSPKAMHLISDLLALKPSKRPKAGDVLGHCWVAAGAASTAGREAPEMPGPEISEMPEAELGDSEVRVPRPRRLQALRARGSPGSAHVDTASDSNGGASQAPRRSFEEGAGGASSIWCVDAFASDGASANSEHSFASTSASWSRPAVGLGSPGRLGCDHSDVGSFSSYASSAVSR